MASDKLNICLLGDISGKTSLIEKYLHDKFAGKYRATLGADFTTTKNKYQLQIWDTSGNENFQSLGVGFYQICKCFILVFDISSKETLDHLEKYKQALYRQVGEASNIPVIVVGTKLDLADPTRKLTFEASNWTKQNFNFDPNVVHYYEASAKTGENVDEIFATAAKLASQWAAAHPKKEELPVIPEPKVETAASYSAPVQPLPTPQSLQPPLSSRWFKYLVDTAEISTELMCPACKCPVVSPVTHNLCGALYCKSCITDVLSHHCLECNEEMLSDSISPVYARVVLAALDSLVVICPYCQHSMERKLLEPHLAKCPVPCPLGCGNFVSPCNQRSHEEKECKNVQIICDMCYAVTLRGEAHECPGKILPCRGKPLGCNWKGKESDVEPHECSCVFAAITPVLRDLKIRVETLEKQNNVLMNELAQIKAHYVQ